MSGEKASPTLKRSDLTQKGKARASHHGDEWLSRALLGKLKAVSWELDPASWSFVSVEGDYEALLGYGIVEWIGQGFWMRTLFEDDREWVERYTRACVEKREDHEYEYRRLRRDGKPMWLKDMVSIVKAGNGQPLRLKGLTMDITPAKWAEDTLRESESRLKKQHEGLVSLASKGISAESGLTGFTEIMAASADITRVGVWELEESGGRFVCLDLYDAVSKSHQSSGVIAGEDFPERFEPIRNGSQIVVYDASADEKIHRLFKICFASDGIGAVLLTPFRVGSRMGGMVGFESGGAPRQWASDERSFALAAAEMVALRFEQMERRKTEEKLRQSETRVRDMLENVRLIAVTLDTNGLITYCNNFLVELTGWSREETLGKSWFDFFVPEEDRQTLKNIFYDTADSLWFHDSYESEVVTREGERRIILWNTIPLWDAKGNLIGVNSVGQDITGRKQVEENLLKANVETGQLLAAIPSILIGVSPEGVVNKWNVAAEKNLGVRAFEAVGRKLQECGAAWDMDEIMAAISECKAGLSQTRRDEVQFIRQDGETGYLGVTVIPVFSDFTSETGILLLGSDVTERKKNQEQLRLAAAVFQSAIEGIMVTDAEGVIQIVNPAFTAITGYLSEEAMGRRADLLKSGRHDAVFYKNMWASLTTSGKWEGEIWNRRKNGEVYPEWLTISAIRDEGGGIVRYVSVFRDITDIKRAEQELRKKSEIIAQSEKLAAIGEMVSGVTHELNQPLNHIGITCQLLSKMFRKKDIGADALMGEIKVIEDNVQRAVEIIRNVRDFSRKETSDYGPVDVMAAVDNAVKMFGSQLKAHDIVLETVRPSRSVMAIGSLNRLAQVIVNLISNARHALDSCKDGREKRITIEVAEQGGSAVIFTRDNGTGIPGNILSEIFNPFFTTKAPGEGTGLGLSISFKIIQEFGGILEVDSTEEGKGTTMKISLSKGRDHENEWK